MFSQLYDHRLVRLVVRRLRRQACECLLQRVLRAARQLRHLLLKHARRSHATLPRSDGPKTSQRAENSVDFFFARLAVPATSASLSCTEPGTRHSHRANCGTALYFGNETHTAAARVP